MSQRPATRPLRVFLCHSSGDKSAVRSLYLRLKEDGFQPWFDEEDLLPGQEWRCEIPRAVKASDVVIVCLSTSAATKRGYFQKEIVLALDTADEQPEGSIFVIPLRLQECAVPARLSRWHWVDFYKDDGYQRLLRTLSKVGLAEEGEKPEVGRTQATRALPPIELTLPHLPPPRSAKKKAKAGVLTLLALSAIGMISWKLWPVLKSPNPPSATNARSSSQEGRLQGSEVRQQEASPEKQNSGQAPLGQKAAPDAKKAKEHEDVQGSALPETPSQASSSFSPVPGEVGPLLGSKNYGGAIETLKHLIDREPLNPEANFMLAKARILRFVDLKGADPSSIVNNFPRFICDPLDVYLASAPTGRYSATAQKIENVVRCDLAYIWSDKKLDALSVMNRRQAESQVARELRLIDWGDQ